MEKKRRTQTSRQKFRRKVQYFGRISGLVAKVEEVGHPPRQPPCSGTTKALGLSGLGLRTQDVMSPLLGILHVAKGW